jgi:lipopolysaccharide export LptBFGC system permease protein LptF
MPLRATLDVLPPGIMHEFGNWRVYIGAKDPSTRTLKNIDILTEMDGQPIAFSAQSAQVVDEGGANKLVLSKGYLTKTTPDGDLVVFAFDSNTLDLPRIAKRAAPGKLVQMTLGELLNNQKQLLKRPMLSSNDKKELRENRSEIGKRFSFPLACISVTLVAAALAARAPRGGRSYSFAVGFTIMLFFFVLYFVLDPRSLKPMPEAVLRSLAPNIVLILTGIGLLWRVDRV